MGVTRTRVGVLVVAWWDGILYEGKLSVGGDCVCLIFPRCLVGDSKGLAVLATSPFPDDVGTGVGCTAIEVTETSPVAVEQVLKTSTNPEENTMFALADVFVMGIKKIVLTCELQSPDSDAGTMRSPWSHGRKTRRNTASYQAFRWVANDACIALHTTKFQTRAPPKLSTWSNWASTYRHPDWELHAISHKAWQLYGMAFM